MADGIEKTAIAWHPAFCSAAEFDLRADRDRLTFEPEHNLSKEPLRMDLLIIKKRKDEVIDNDIARIFRKYNVIEYKSPDDGLTIDDFYKTIGYACLYKGTAHTVDEIPADEITVSVFRETLPEKLIETLKVSGAAIIQTAPGVYTIPDMKPFPAQIIATKELDLSKHAGLRILSRNSSETDLEEFLLQAKEEHLQGEKLNIDSILKVSYAANRQAFADYKERNEVMSDILKELMRDELEEARNEGTKQGIKEGIIEGIIEGKKEGATEKSKETAKSLYEMGMDISFISKALKVTDDTVRKWLGIQTA